MRCSCLLASAPTVCWSTHFFTLRASVSFATQVSSLALRNRLPDWHIHLAQTFTNPYNTMSRTSTCILHVSQQVTRRVIGQQLGIGSALEDEDDALYSLSCGLAQLALRDRASHEGARGRRAALELQARHPSHQQRLEHLTVGVVLLVLEHLSANALEVLNAAARLHRDHQ